MSLITEILEKLWIKQINKKTEKEEEKGKEV